LKPPRPTQSRKPELKEITGIERHELMLSAESDMREEIYEYA